MFVESSGSPRHLLLPKAFFIRVSLASKDLLELDHEKFSFTHVLHYKNKIPALWQQEYLVQACYFQLEGWDFWSLLLVQVCQFVSNCAKVVDSIDQGPDSVIF